MRASYLLERHDTGTARCLTLTLNSFDFIFRSNHALMGQPVLCVRRLLAVEFCAPTKAGSESVAVS